MAFLLAFLPVHERLKDVKGQAVESRKTQYVVAVFI